MKTLPVLLLLASGYCFAQQTVEQGKVYKSKDKRGVVVYSDKKTDKAKELVLPSSSVIHSQPATPKPRVRFSPNRANLATVNKPISKPAINYQVEILNPVAEQTIRNNAGTISLQTQISPSLQSTLLVQAKSNGEVVGQSKNPSFQLQALPRGQHSLTVEIVDSSGKVIATSAPVIFYLFRTSVIKPG